MELVRRSPGFARLWAAAAASQFGDWLSFVALGALALDGGGGPLALVVVLAAHALPGAVVAPLAGALVDRYDRRRVLVAVELTMAGLTAAMALAAATGALATLPLLLLARSGLGAAVPAAETAAVRRLVDPDDLPAANAALAATWSAAYVLGMAAGGAAAMLGPTLALALDAGTFAVAAWLHGGLPPQPVTRARVPLTTAVAAVPRDTAAAMTTAWRDRPLLAALLGKSPAGLASGAGWIGLNLIAASAQPFGPAALSLGILQAVRGVGTGVGPWLAGRYLAGGGDPGRAQRVALATLLAALMALAVARSPVALIAVALVWGAGTGTNWTLAHAALQRHASDRTIGRLAAMDELLVSAAMVAGAAVAAAVAEQVGVGAAAAAAVGLGGLGLVAARAVVAAAPEMTPAR